jgi:hypothetical protein
VKEVAEANRRRVKQEKCSQDKIREGLANGKEL